MIYTDITDVANKEEKHSRTVSASRNRAGAEAAGAGIRGGCGAWIEWVSGCKPANNKKPERCGLGRGGFQQKLKSGKRTERRQPDWLHLIRIAGE